MPNLGPIVNLQDDMRAQMALAQQIGGAVGRGIADRRQQTQQQQADRKIRLEEQRIQFAQQEFVALTNRAVQEDWSGPRFLDEMAKNKAITETKWGRQQQAQFAMQQIQERQRQRQRQQPDIFNGPGGMKYTYDPQTGKATPIEGMQPTGGQSVDSTKELTKWLTVQDKAILAGDEETEKLADEKIQQIRDRVRGTTPEARQKMVDLEELDKRLKTVRQNDTLEMALKGLPQDTNRQGARFDDTKNPERVKENLLAYANKLVREYGFTEQDAIRETQQQYLDLLAADSGRFQVYPRGVGIETARAAAGTQQPPAQTNDYPPHYQPEPGTAQPQPQPQADKPPVPELAPYWKDMTAEEKQTAITFLQGGGDVQQIIGLLQ